MPAPYTDNELASHAAAIHAHFTAHYPDNVDAFEIIFGFESMCLVAKVDCPAARRATQLEPDWDCYASEIYRELVDSDIEGRIAPFLAICARAGVKCSQAERDAEVRAQRKRSHAHADAIESLVVPTHGRIWWIANSKDELIQSLIDLTAKGAVIESVSSASPVDYSYVFRLERANADAVLGYEPDDEEWLIE